LAALLEAVSSGFIELQKASDILLSATHPFQSQVSKLGAHFTSFIDGLQHWEAGDLTVMNERLCSLMSFDGESQKYINDPDSAPTTTLLSAQGSDIGGWRLLDHHSGWKSCPIGVYYPNHAALSIV
jgi:ribosomal biogenesis protein LAS1